MTINEHSITFPSLSLIVNIKPFFLSVTILLNSVPRFIEAILKPKFPPSTVGIQSHVCEDLQHQVCTPSSLKCSFPEVSGFRVLHGLTCELKVLVGFLFVIVFCCFFNFVLSLLFFMMSCFVICLFIILHLVILIFTLWLYLHYYGFHFSLNCLCIYVPLIELTMPSLIIT